MMVSSFVKGFLFLAATSLTAAAPAKRNVPVLPSVDPFYHLPANVGSLKPGAIIRHRPPQNPIAAFGSDPVNLAGSYQLLYRTTDSLGNATATALTVLLPHNADLTKVISYQVAEDASYVNCAPSYALQLDHAEGPDHGTAITEAEILLMEAVLEQGYVVIVPDHLGANSAFLANAQSGHATLDGIRAAIASSSFTGISKNPTVAMRGYSGGSVASMWAAELQPSYAPELKIAGAAVGGAVPNITTVMNVINNTRNSGLIPAGVTGLMNQYPELGVVVNNHLLPQYKDQFFKAKTQCFQADLDEYQYMDILHWFDDPTFPYTNPVARKILDANALGKHTPRIPMFVYKGMKDEISPYQETDALVNKYCSDGASIYYHRDEWTDHGSLAILAAPIALSWLKDTLHGRNTGKSCSTKTVPSSAFDPTWLTVFPKVLADALLDLLGKPVGPVG